MSIASPTDRAEEDLAHLKWRPFLPELLQARAAGYQKLGTKSTDREGLGEEIKIAEQKRGNRRISHQILLKFHELLGQ